ncbi:hypothetical protein JM79_1883 [Gramella sp. Hel_I_59]|uniref:hypothetical protein n=1 Tax=Gramella sp. Hel_I_59 TaxID=1249978 RepID=UPI00114DFB3C|nr:hypothetical protein [Gramella sp. Hel_I_59]TQI70957.1 hypothetical protein JM79_1883 [Gramella sp. Hel_I_59]
MRLASRKYATEFILSNNLLPQTIELIKFPQELSIKAWMIIEMLGRDNCAILGEFMSTIINSGKLYSDSSSKRCMMKIFGFLVESHFYKNSPINLNPAEIEEIIRLSFKFLMNDEKTAVKVFAMQNIYDLRTEEKWIESELKALLEKDISASTSGYRARALKILRKL